jgi:hypothetical protein
LALLIEVVATVRLLMKRIRHFGAEFLDPGSVAIAITSPFISIQRMLAVGWSALGDGARCGGFRAGAFVEVG